MPRTHTNPRAGWTTDPETLARRSPDGRWIIHRREAPGYRHRPLVSYEVVHMTADGGRLVGTFDTLRAALRMAGGR